MKALSEPELKEFINNLDQIAVSIGIIRQRGKMGPNPLTSQEEDALLLEQIKILRASARVTAQHITFEFDNIRAQLEALKKATASMEKTLSRIRTVQEILDFSTLAVKIADEVVSGDALAFSRSVDTLINNINALNHRASSKRKT